VANGMLLNLSPLFWRRYLVFDFLLKQSSHSPLRDNRHASSSVAETFRFPGAKPWRFKNRRYIPLLSCVIPDLIGNPVRPTTLQRDPASRRFPASPAGGGGRDDTGGVRDETVF